MHCYDPATEGELPDCPGSDERGEPLLDPVLEYGHDQGIAVVGGYVYNGRSIVDLQGRYVFADWSGTVFVASMAAPEGWSWPFRRLGSIPSTSRPGQDLRILSLGEDQAGELYALVSENPYPSGHTGAVYRLEAGAP
jgi:hypothetical protein